MDAATWVETELEPRDCASTAFIYDHMDSQSGRSLPGIYQPFDPAQRAHWYDAGSTLDFMHAAGVAGARMLDLGPGDGWPSLPLAPAAAEVVGVDGSERRVAVCRENARRLGIANAEFVHVPPGERLPFPNASFDGVVAASSLEQTPDPRATVRELARVLRPGGRLRIHYEALSAYRGGREREAELWGMTGGAMLMLYQRDAALEQAVQYGLVLDLEPSAAGEILGQWPVQYARLDEEAMERLRPHVTEARRCRLSHPSALSLSRWLRGSGFLDVRATHDGGRFAGRLFDLTPAERRPADRAGVVDLLEAPVRCAVEMAAPLEADPPITAIRG